MFTPSAFAAALAPAGKKPTRWDWSPSVSSLPEVFAGDYRTIPFHEIRADGVDSYVHVLGQGQVLANYSNALFSPAILRSGPGASLTYSAVAGTTEWFGIDNIIGGKSEFTCLAVCTPSGVNEDATILGRWNSGLDTIILHFDNNSQVRFLLQTNAGTVGNWGGSYSANNRYKVAARLKSNGTMDLFINGAKSTVRTGSAVTVSTNANDLGVFSDSGGNTNKPFGGSVEFLHLVDKGLSDALIRAWTKDEFAPIRADLSKVLPTYAVPASGTTLSPITETDTALPLSAARVRTLLPIAETDSAVALSTTRARTLDAVAETDSPVALTGKRVQTLGVAAETDTALPLSTSSGTTLTPATETDTALPLSTARVRTLSPIAETDAAVALSTARARTLDAVGETDSPVALTGKRVQTLGVAAETDTALPLSTGDGTFEDDVVRFAVDLPAIRATATIGAIRATISRAA